MRQLDGVRATLSALVERVRTGTLHESESDPGFTPLIDVVSDTGRALALQDPEDLRRALPALANLREILESEYSPETISKSPFDALRNEKATPYAAGALWATSAVVYAALGQWDVAEERVEERRGRQPVRERVLEILEEEGQVRHGDVMDALEQEGRRVDKSVVSRCLGDLLKAGLIAPVEVSRSSDRRHRYYRLVDADAVHRALLDRASGLVKDLLSWRGPEEAKRLLCLAIDREAAGKPVQEHALESSVRA